MPRNPKEQVEAALNNLQMACNAARDRQHKGDWWAKLMADGEADAYQQSINTLRLECSAILSENVP